MSNEMRDKHVASVFTSTVYKWKDLAARLKAEYDITSEEDFEDEKEQIRAIIRDGYIKAGRNVEERREKKSISSALGRVKKYMFAEEKDEDEDEDEEDEEDEDERKDTTSKKPLSVLMKRLREEVIGEDDKKYKRLYEAYLRMCDEEVDEE